MNKIYKFLTLSLFACMPFLTHAHVAYVVSPSELSENLGPDTNYLMGIFTEPSNILLMVGTIIGILLVVLISKKSKRITHFFSGVSEKLTSYHEFIPWIIRLSLGILLIGAGTEGALISPIISNAWGYSMIQIALGFAFLLGFLLVPSALVTIGLYIVGLTQDIYLIGNIDVLALALGLLVFHSARPGVDDILGISLLRFLKIERHYLALLVRVLVGIGFTYLALYEKLLNPHISEVVVMNYGLASLIPVSPEMWVFSVGIIELILGIFIFIGFYTRTSACVAIVVLSTTFFFFKESVYSHVTLFGILSIIAIEGGGMLSIDRFFANRRNVIQQNS